VPDGVDAAVDGVEAARCEAPLDRALADAQGAQLRERDDAVLPPSQLGHPDIRGFDVDHPYGG